VTERRWHSTQEFTELEDGGVRMTMQVGLAPDLYSWIGGFFVDCRVVKPETLRETMRRLHAASIDI
jgi:predicted DNA-binding transcriptional regulator YafY